MLIIKETGCRVYGNSLYFPFNFLINLKSFKKNTLLKKEVKEKNTGDRGTESSFCDMGGEVLPSSAGDVSFS